MTDKTRLTAAIGTLTAASFSLGAIASVDAGEELFELEDLDHGFMMASAAAVEGKCGEESEEEKSEEGACGEGACGEGTCGEGACGEGACGEGSCGNA